VCGLSGELKTPLPFLKIYRFLIKFLFSLQSRYFDCDDFDSDSYAEVAGLEDGEENFYSPEEEKCYSLAMTQNWEAQRYNNCDSQENISGDNEPTSIDEHQHTVVVDENA
jgi:hypothetical protein